MGASYAAETPTREILRLIFELARYGAASCVALAEKAYRRRPQSLGSSSEADYKRLAYYAKSRGYLAEQDGRIMISQKGLERLERLGLRPVLVPQKWDKQWRIVSFDIPEQKRLARNAIRRLIKRLGFLQLHASVWIYPHDCAQQIQLIREAYRASNDIRLIIAKQVDGQEDLLEQFTKAGIIK